jgi:capsular exopolysaccharide synthesis family protein
MVLEVEKKVLLVDADLVRPSLHRVLGIDSSAQGLLDVLENKCSVLESILHTNIPKLSVMPAGRPRLNSTELLASTTMRRLADELSTRYADRIVIFDTSPVLATTQALVLASVVGQVVVVTAAIRSTRKQLQRALGVLEGIKNVSVVLNQSRGRVSDFCFDAY